MELIYVRTDESGVQTSGFLSNFEAAFEISTDLDYVTNNFTITMELPETKDGLLWAENEISCFVYVEGTEYGGEILGSEISIADNTIKYSGRTWRGCLAQWIIEPPAGEDYLIVSGNLADSLRLLPMGSFIEVADTAYSGGTYQFNRYVTTFEGATNLLTAALSSLRMAFSFEPDGYGGKAVLSIIKARDRRNEIEVSQDYNDSIQLTIVRDSTTPRHLICLGTGELKEREVVHLYADENWNISTTPIAGAYPVEVYDINSSEDLLADGRKHFLELIHNHEQIEVNINNLDIQLSDIIGGKDILTNETVSAEITTIVWRVENYGDYQTELFEYKTRVLDVGSGSSAADRSREGGEAADIDSMSNTEIEELLN